MSHLKEDKIKKMTWILVPKAIIDTSSGKPVLPHILDRIAKLDIPLKAMQKIANKFGGYVEVKLLPLKPKRSSAKRPKHPSSSV